MEHTQQRQDIATVKDLVDAIGRRGAEQAAQRIKGHQSCHDPFTGMRVPAFINDRPETTDKQAGQNRRLQEEHHRNARRKSRQQEPLQEKQQAAADEHGWYKRCRATPRENTRKTKDCDTGQGRGHNHHQWQVGNIEVGQEKGVSSRLAGIEIGHHHHARYRRGKDADPFVGMFCVQNIINPGRSTIDIS